MKKRHVSQHKATSVVGNLFYDALSATTLYSVDDRVASEL